jgi:hypothetical protein
MIHKVIRLDSEGEIVEVIGESSEESEAKRIASEADVIEGQEIEIISEVTNDKSGKATSLDRILIIAPENAEPRPYLENDEMVWEPIYGSSKQITLKSFSNH